MHKELASILDPKWIKFKLDTSKKVVKNVFLDFKKGANTNYYNLNDFVALNCLPGNKTGDIVDLTLEPIGLIKKMIPSYRQMIHISNGSLDVVFKPKNVAPNKAEISFYHDAIKNYPTYTLAEIAETPKIASIVRGTLKTFNSTDSGHVKDFNCVQQLVRSVEGQNVIPFEKVVDYYDTSAGIWKVKKIVNILRLINFNYFTYQLQSAVKPFIIYKVASLASVPSTEINLNIECGGPTSTMVFDLLEPILRIYAYDGTPFSQARICQSISNKKTPGERLMILLDKIRDMKRQDGVYMTASPLSNSVSNSMMSLAAINYKYSYDSLGGGKPTVATLISIRTLRLPDFFVESQYRTFHEMTLTDQEMFKAKLKYYLKIK